MKKKSDTNTSLLLGIGTMFLTSLEELKELVPRMAAEDKERKEKVLEKDAELEAFI